MAQLNSPPELKPILVFSPQQCVIAWCLLPLCFLDFQRARVITYTLVHLVTTMRLTQGARETVQRLRASTALRGHEFDSQRPPGGSQTGIPTSPRDPIPLLASTGSRHLYTVQTYTQANINTHISKDSLWGEPARCLSCPSLTT